MKIATIIVAAGAGQRAGSPIPKQFVKIGNRPMLMRTIENFTYLSGEIIVVLNVDYVQYWVELCDREGFNVEHKVAAGGAERTASVAAGLSVLSDDAQLVLVQDAARPFTSRDVIDRVVAAAAQSGAAVPALPVTDSLRRAKGAMDRRGVYAVQTPQGFAADVLKEAYGKNHKNLSDDAAVVENSGHRVAIVEGDVKNIKITTPFDLQIAEILC